MYKKAYASETLSEYDHKIPLLLLNPDNEGYSALYHSIKEESPKSFELMCSLLNDFDGICLSKMVLKSLPVILGHESPPVYEFFETAYFKTHTMDKPLFVPWHEEMDDFVFCCNTSIVSTDLVTRELGFAVEKKKPETNELSLKMQSTGQKNEIFAEMKRQREAKLEKMEAAHARKSNLKGKGLTATFVND